MANRAYPAQFAKSVNVSQGGDGRNARLERGFRGVREASVGQGDAQNP